MLNLFIGVLSSSMDVRAPLSLRAPLPHSLTVVPCPRHTQEARSDLTMEAERQKAEQDKDEDEIVQERLKELGQLMEEVRCAVPGGCGVRAVLCGWQGAVAGTPCCVDRSYCPC